MKSIAFTLSMPNRGSWNGCWSGEDNLYCVVRRYRDDKAAEILKRHSFYYRWSDGWGASIAVAAVDPAHSRQLKRKSKGFCGYEWMIDSIERHFGLPLDCIKFDSEMEQQSFDDGFRMRQETADMVHLHNTRVLQMALEEMLDELNTGCVDNESHPETLKKWNEGFKTALKAVRGLLPGVLSEHAPKSEGGSSSPKCAKCGLTLEQDAHEFGFRDHAFVAPKSEGAAGQELAQTEAVGRKYYELLFAVENKYEGESRHQTALRYIMERGASMKTPSVPGAWKRSDASGVSSPNYFETETDLGEQGAAR